MAGSLLLPARMAASTFRVIVGDSLLTQSSPRRRWVRSRGRTETEQPLATMARVTSTLRQLLFTDGSKPAALHAVTIAW